MELGFEKSWFLGGADMGVWFLPVYDVILALMKLIYSLYYI